MALVQERSEILLDMEELSSFLYSYIYRETPLPRIRELREKMSKIPDLCLSIQRYHDSREQAITRSLRFGVAWRKFIKSENLTKKEEFEIAYENSFELTLMLTHYTFFLPSFILQASDSQIQEWKTKIENLEIIGCYAQTELGHGSNVKGLEIEAVYDHASKEFVLNSPTVTATKWWIGGLGVGANFALIIAQLVINQNNYGPHPFLVPIRDLNTHVPFEGIEIGDIGPKIGLHSNDNGFIRFHKYRIPQKYMLTRFSKINDQGEYEVIDPNSIKILYLSLVKARLAILTDAWFPLYSALTISIRYSIVRQQFADPENPKQEKKIIDYQIQQYKLFKQLSKLYAMVFARVNVLDVYNKAEKEAIKGQSSSLSLAHCLVCLYKVYASSTVLEGIEQCRRSCGGHGYLMISGLPSLYTSFLPKVTYDGENNILALQAIKYLISLNHKKHPKEFAYLFSSKIVPTGDPLSGSFQQQCFQAAAQYKMQKLHIKLQKLKARFSKEKIWNDYLQVEGIEATEAVFYAHIHGIFYENIGKISSDKNRAAIEGLRLIYGVCELERYFGILLTVGVSLESLDLMKNAMIDALKNTRQHALGLIEAFEIRDEALHSVLGRKDGDIYKHMLDNAKNSNPVNKHKVFPGFLEIVRPKI